MRRIGIIGGETHVNEVTALDGTRLGIAAAAVRPDQADWATQQFGCEVLHDVRDLITLEGLDMTAQWAFPAEIAEVMPFTDRFLALLSAADVLWVVLAVFSAAAVTAFDEDDEDALF